MKASIITAAFIVLNAAAGAANAVSCPAVAALDNAGIHSALDDKMIHAQAPAPSGEDWKEDHCSNGKLFKVGAGTAVDPRALKGTWTVTADPGAKVEYNYTGAPPIYSFELRESSGILYFCNAGNEVAHTLSIGSLTGAC
jgi:hypothetical protein